jgi:hypothetical protein
VIRGTRNPGATSPSLDTAYGPPGTTLTLHESWRHFPEDLGQFQRIPSRSSFISEALWLNRWKNVSGTLSQTPC